MDSDVMFSVSDAVYRNRHPRAQRWQEMCEKEDNIFNSHEFRIFWAPSELPLDFLLGDRHASLRLQSPANCNGKQDFTQPSPKPVVEEEEEEEDEEIIRISWKQILQLLTKWDPLIHYSACLSQLELDMNVTTTVHKILAMRLPEQNILKT